MKYEVSKDFDNIYTYLERRLVEANVKKIRKSSKRSIPTCTLSVTTGKKS